MEYLWGLIDSDNGGQYLHQYIEAGTGETEADLFDSVQSGSAGGHAYEYRRVIVTDKRVVQKCGVNESYVVTAHYRWSFES